jgi:hypothetical protein
LHISEADFYFFSSKYAFSLFYQFNIYTRVYILLGPYSPFPPPTSRQNLFCPFVLQFYCRENIRDNKKGTVFLLVSDKDSYTERFLALLPCTCVLQPTLVHLYLTSSLLPSPLPIVTSASLRLLYLLLYNEHINHIQVSGFLPFPYSSHSSLTVWPTSNNMTAFVLDL